MCTTKIPINRVCYSCGSDKTWINKFGNQQWRKHDNHSYCHKCHNKLFLNPECAARNRIRRLTFKDKRLTLKDAPRKGVCEWCNRKIGDEYIAWRNKVKTVNFTLIHHIEYHPEDPLKDTVELCMSCHHKEHWRLRKS